MRIALPLTLSASRRRGLSLWRFMALRRSRRALAALDDAALRDVGIKPEDAQAEATRPIWDAPAAWRD
ncbi:DUF1127 domain-containing protein [Sulfitobacter sp. HNIBRBA2951]|uniref:DUF1127 domain-containing protein n=1 Tax=Sulfitobacter aquimarinus TaxID=3158557 RepID=UPI0032E04DB1